MKATTIAVFLGILSICAYGQGAAVNSDNAEYYPNPFMPLLGNPTTNNIDFGTALKMFYTAFEQIMPCGYAAYDLPSLAPFTLSSYDLNVDNDNMNFNLSISNLMVTGMNDFRILNLSSNFTNNRTSFDFFSPKIQLLADVVFKGEFNIAGIPVKVDITGPVNIKTIDARLMGGFKLEQSTENANGLQMSDFDFKFYIGDIVFNNWNNLWDISGNDFFNRWAREFTLMWTQHSQNEVQDLYRKLVVPAVNSVLANTNMNELISFFLQQTSQLEQAAVLCAAMN